MTGPIKPDPGYDFRKPLRSFPEVTRGVLLDPARFFADLRGEVSYAGPVLYAVACQLVAVLLAGLYDFGRAVLAGGAGEISVVGVEGAPGAALWGIWLLGLAPFYALATLTVGAAVYHLLVLMTVGRTNRGFGATFRVTAYLSAVSLLIWLPVAGLLAGLWGVWVNTQGLKQLHTTTTPRALPVAAIPYVLSLAWSVYWILSGGTTPTEFLVGGGTMFPTTQNPLGT